jgi:hypothetical protein
MKGRLWWSSVLPLTAMMCLSFATAPEAKAQAVYNISPNASTGQGSLSISTSSVGRKRPGLIDPLCGLTVGTTVGPSLNTAACNSQDGREWEGLNSTDYLTTLSIDPNVAPNPDIAAGPDDILTVVNGIIARYPNYNAPAATMSREREYTTNQPDSRPNPAGTLSVPYQGSPASLGAYVYPPSSRQWLDVWLGEAALAELCPSQTRTFATCVIANTSVRYDQMQGRFVVLFTVVDTGAVHCRDCADVVPATATGRRKASWVLITSKWATGCQAVTIPGSFTSAPCVPNTSPSAPPLSGNTLFFTSPNPPGPSQSNPNSGGVNGNWMAYYGIADGTCDAACLNGNINSISDVRRGSSYGSIAPTIDCTNSAIGDVYQDANNTSTSSTRVCYFPSSARLGIDNDNIIISSSVYNDNVPLSQRVLRNGGSNLDPANIPFEGTRLRVHKKAGFYTQLSSISIAGTGGEGCAFNAVKMCPGSSQPNPGATDLQGDFYDLWDTTAGQPVYTFDKTLLQPVPGGSNRTVPGPHYEPDHVRGRSLASYNGNANLDGAFSTIWGTVNQGFTATIAPQPQTRMYHRVIRYTRQPQGTLVANGQLIPATVDVPKIQGGIPDLWSLQSHEVPQFLNPNTVTQRTMLAGGTTPYLYVGDNRPHRVISREGHHYIARVGATPTFTGFSGQANESTVIYDIVQKLSTGTSGAQTQAGEVYNTSWGNGNFYAPAYDTPANVVQYGSISPINVGPFLEKLFVGTTYPALSPSDTRIQNYGNAISAAALLACTGQEPSVNSNGRSFPGLFDMRCGEDAYDRRTDLRHPISGAFTYGDFEVRLQPAGFGSDAQRSFLVPFGTRSGASTDVNNLGMWVYGAYARGRLASIAGAGQWGTYVSFYPLTFPVRDPYNNLILSYADVQPGHVFYPYVQIAKQTEIDPGSRLAGPTENFNPDEAVLRGVMAKWVVRAQMDEAAISAYLTSTGGAFCSFADACGVAVGADFTSASGVTATGAAPNYWRYVETMYRRGYTKGCADTNDGQRRFCPGSNLSRGEMAVFIIRAKTNSVFPTATSGAFTTVSCQPGGTNVANVGDQFGLFVGCNGESQYFADVPNTHIYYAFIQKLRELRITNGTDLTNRLYSPAGGLTKGQLMTFLVRAFFP